MTPYMGANEIKMIEGYLKPEMWVLEIGAGGSTLHFPQFIDHWQSMEHDHAWCEKLLAEGLPDNAEITCIYGGHKVLGERKPDPDYDWYVEYVRIHALNYHPHAVLIDGRARVRCARAILPHITPDTIIFFHDFLQPTRTYYLDVLRDYELIDHCAWFPGGGGSLGVLRKRAV